MYIVKNTHGCVLRSLEMHPALFLEHIILTQSELAATNSLQETSLMKFHHSTLTQMTQMHVPQSSSIIIELNRGSSTYICTPQQYVNIVDSPLSFHHGYGTLGDPEGIAISTNLVTEPISM